MSNLHIVSVDIGTTTRIRLAIEHDRPDCLDSGCKAAIAQLASHCFTQALHTKVRFYNEAAQAVPVAVPRFLAAQSQPGKGATLVLKDITESGAIPGNPGDALTAEQAALVVKQLACFQPASGIRQISCELITGWPALSVASKNRLGTALTVPLMQRGLSGRKSHLPGSPCAGCLLFAALAPRDVFSFKCATDTCSS
ncbi:MAG: hypothetical protein ABI167_11045 [Nitrosospira sp.]